MVGADAFGVAGGPGSIAGLAAGLLVLLALGDGLLRLLGRAGMLHAAGSAGALGFRILLGLASVPWLCLLMDLTTIPITRLTFALAALVLLAAGVRVDRRGWVRWVLPISGSARPHWEAGKALGRLGAAIRRAPAAAVLVLGAGSIVLYSIVQVGLSEPRAYDALVGYDAVGKLMAYEGHLRSTLFRYVAFDPQCVYPPFTSCNQGFWYLFYPPIQRLWVPILAAGFLLAFWSWVHRWTASPTAAGVAAFLVLLPPELAFHLTEGQTDLPSMVYTAMAMLAAVAWLRGRGGAGPVAFFMLCATTARSENVLFAAALSLAGFCAVRNQRWQAIWVLVPTVAFFVFWNVIFVKGLLGYDPGAHFRKGIPVDPARMVEVFRLAARIISRPGAFGEFAWMIPLTVALWLLGRRGKPGLPHDPGATGPLLFLAALCFVLYMPFFYMWDDKLNPLWTMEHTFKRGFFRFVPPLMAAAVAAPPLLALLRRCERDRDLPAGPAAA